VLLALVGSKSLAMRMRVSKASADHAANKNKITGAEQHLLSEDQNAEQQILIRRMPFKFLPAATSANKKRPAPSFLRRHQTRHASGFIWIYSLSFEHYEFCVPRICVFFVFLHKQD